MKSVLKQIRDQLECGGMKVYYPAQHKGECIAEYVVVAYSGSIPDDTVSSVIDTYDIMCYVPENRYSTIISFVECVRNGLRGLFPLIRDGGNSSVTFYDEAVKGYSVTLTYVNYRKTKNY